MKMNIEIIGSNNNYTDKDEINTVSRIIRAYAEGQSSEEKIRNQMIGVKLRMNSYLNNQINSTLITTGEFLNEILVIYGIRINKFAKYIDIEESNLHAILKGRRKINNKIAKKLDSIFGIQDSTWLFIETKNELNKYNEKYSKPAKPYSIKELVK